MDVTIQEHAGSHRDLLWSFREADDSESALESYIDLGRVWVAVTPVGETVGHLQAVPRGRCHWEVTNTAVTEPHRGHGIGRALLDRAVHEAWTNGITHVILATAAADTGILRFYQRCGFRLTHVVHDVFTPANGYPTGLEVDGIPLRDQGVARARPMNPIELRLRGPRTAVARWTAYARTTRGTATLPSTDMAGVRRPRPDPGARRPQT